MAIELSGHRVDPPEEYVFEEQDAPRPTISDEDLALVARRRHHATQLLQRVSAPFDEEIERLKRELESVEAQRESALRPYQRRIEWFDALLSEYALRRREETSEATLRLPYVTVETRRTPERVEVDEAAVEHLPEPFVRIKKEVDKKAILAHIKATGEVPEGVRLVPGEIKVTVKEAGE